MNKKSNQNLQIIQKPRLVFFQWKWNQKLSSFIVLHRQQQIKCLSEFFEVIVINEDCDYQEVCDKYLPDVALFEGGVAYDNCNRPKIKNTNTNIKVPKLGLHNSDSWCNSRAGFISEMENWGVETFFSISTTTREHIPEIANQIFIWPNFIDNGVCFDYKMPKIIPVFCSGYSHSLYPWRNKVFNEISKYYPSLISPHTGYDSKSEYRTFSGERFARTINASWFVPTCGTTEKELVRKHLEIPGCKSCLITEQTPVIEAAGFVDMENCIFADDHNVIDKIDYLFRNSEELENIINAGYNMVQSRHTIKERNQIAQWLELSKTIKFDEKIVQNTPFEPLKIATLNQDRKPIQLHSNGLTLELLKQGDHQLKLQKYSEAEVFYYKCIEYIYWLVEPKLRIAICKLNKGDAAEAINWILQPIEYTLKKYSAIDPDPVEWSYLIIALICRGKLSYAIKTAEQFPTLNHEDLERARWLTNVLKNDANKIKPIDIKIQKHRCSVHKLPSLTFEEWVQQIREMLISCKKFSYLRTLDAYLAQEDKLFDALNILENRQKIDSKGQSCRNSGSQSTQNTEALLLIDNIRLAESRTVKNIIKKKVKDWVIKILSSVSNNKYVKDTILKVESLSSS